jgi:hypothetical protein
MTTTLLSLLPLLSLAANPAATTSESHEPAVTTDVGGFELSLPLSARGIVDVATPYAVDAEGGEMSALPAGVGVIRPGFFAESGWFLHPFGVKLGLEGDAIGTLGNLPELAGDGYAYAEDWQFQLRQAWVGGGFAYFLSGAAGAMTSHWGLGLLSNDGAHGGELGDASFSFPVGGDRVLRAAVNTGPWPEYYDLKLSVAADRVIDDDMTFDGDNVYQAVVALSVGENQPHGAGVYAARRHADTALSARTDVWVVDATARTELTPIDGLRLYAAAEGAVIAGETTLAPNPVFEKHDVLQLGATARAGAQVGDFGLVMDFVYASGDQNLEDASQNAFRVDPNLQQGMLLFRHVLAGQTARGVGTASDPILTGKPAQDLERFSTRGSISNAWVFFPRGSWRPLDSLEIYGGPMVAVTDVPLIDPRNTRLNGGVARNALGNAPGRFLGAELDLGVRWRQELGPVQAAISAEGGALLPGDAIAHPEAAPIFGTRMLLELRL